jgi:hypothetical protein
MASTACNACRQGHRKCDKKLPNCTQCSKSHRLCIYQDPTTPKQRNNRECEHRFRYQPYNIPQKKAFPVENTLPETCNVIHLDENITRTFILTPIMSRSKAMSLSSTINVNNLTSEEEKLDVAVLLAFHAHTSINVKGTSNSQQCFDIAYDLVSKCFDRIFTNFHVAATYCFLGMYLWDQNKLDRARFFIENVVSYLRSNKPIQSIGTGIQSEINHLRYGLLFFLCDCTKLFAADHVNLSLVLKRIIAGYYVTSTYEKICNVNTNADSIDGDDKQHYQQMVDNDFVHGGLDFDITSLDKLIIRFNARLMTYNNNEQDKKIISLLCLALGAKIQRLKSHDENHVAIRQIADQICIWLERSSNWQCHHHPCVSCSAQLAIHAHMKSMKESSDKYQILAFLKADLRAITILTMNSKYWQKKHESVILEAESVVKKTEEELLSHLPSDHTLLGLPLLVERSYNNFETNLYAPTATLTDPNRNINEEHIDAFLEEFLRNADDNLFAV